MSAGTDSSSSDATVSSPIRPAETLKAKQKLSKKPRTTIRRIPLRMQGDNVRVPPNKRTVVASPSGTSFQAMESSSFSSFTISSSLTIRSMKLRDLATVFELGNTIFTASEFPNLHRTFDDFAVVENFAASPDFCFVAEAEDGSLIGFLMGEALTKANVGTRGYIQWVAVLPEYRRKGIATRLVQQFQTKARDDEIYLWFADTPADNEPALRLFHQAGLRTPSDHVYLTRQLPDEIEPTHVSDDGYCQYSFTTIKGKVTIRTMEIQDLNPVFLLGESIFTTDSPNLYNFWDQDLVLQSYLSDPELCIVATVSENEDSDEEQVVGFALSTTIEKPRSAWKYGHLLWLGCSTDYQGLGLASQLYKITLELFCVERVRMVMVDTQSSNEAALKFFRKNGFLKEEEHLYLSNASPRPQT